MWQPDIEGDTRGAAELTECYRHPPYDVARSAKNTVPQRLHCWHGLPTHRFGARHSERHHQRHGLLAFPSDGSFPWLASGIDLPSRLQVLASRLAAPATAKLVRGTRGLLSRSS